MKKLLAIALVGMLVLTGCGKGKETPETPETPGTETSSVQIGTAVVNGVKAEDAGEKPGKFESNVTYATVVLEDGAIKSVFIDTAQNSVAFTDAGLEEFAAKGTKKELGDAYGMSEKGLVEWDKQIASLEEYLVGKTPADVKAETASSDLNSTVSITIDGYIEAVTKAIESAVAVEGLDKVGTVSSVSAKTEDPEKVEINTVVSAVGLDKDGKVVYAFADESQLKAAITGATVVAGEELRTKGQQGNDYGMSKDGMVEWDQQVKTLVEWTKGKNAEEIAKAGDEADVTSTVSIYIGGFVSTLEAAVAAAK